MKIPFFGFLLIFLCFVTTTRVYAAPIHEAVKSGNLNRVREIIKSDPSAVNARGEKYGDTPLHKAVMSDDLQIAAFLISKGADVKAKSKLGWTPLHQAKSRKMAKLLVEKGADIEAKDRDGYTPLHTAATLGNLETAKYLVEKGANVNARGNQGETPLQLALKSMQMDIAEMLRKHGAEEE